jgi:outer membrane receptor protein involved in Fe transport
MLRILGVTAGVMLYSQCIFCQQLRPIQGVVMDGLSHEPLIGVNIRDVQENTGTVTKMNGTFSINITHAGDSLLASYTGYRSRKIPADKKYLTIALIPSATSLNELVVTASRGVQQRIEAPVAIGVVSPAMIRETKPVTLDQVLNKVSGVYMVNLGNEQHTMAIRQPIGYRSNFLYLQDGIPIRTIGDFNHNALIEINQAAVKRIEVIKGPSSSLYGSDAIGGAVNFITKAPAVMPDAELTFEGSSWGYRRADFTASNTLHQTGILVSGYAASQHGGYIQHGDFHKLAVTAKVEQALGEKSKLSAMATWINYYTDQNGGLDSAHFFGKNFKSFYTFTYRKVKALRARVSWQQHWNSRQQSRLTFYYHDNEVGQNPFYSIKSTGNPLKARGEINNNYFQSYGMLAQHSWRLSPWDTHLLAGLHAEISPAGYLARYIAIDKNEAGYFTRYTKTDSSLTDYRVDMLSTAAYFQVQTQPAANLRVVAGLRYDRLDYNFDNHLTPSAYTGAPDQRNRFRQLTPKVGVTYDFGNDRGAYANYSIGFAPPDISDLYRGVKVPYLKSARYFNYEMGGWLSFNNHKGYADLSLYRMNGVNEIVSVRLPDGSYINRNAGRTAHYGIEYTIKYRPVSQWRLRLSGTNARHRFIDYIEQGKDYSGNEMNGAPHWIMNTEVMYTPGFLKGLTIALECQHLSSYYMDPANTQRYPGYYLFNARVNYTWRKFECWAHLINCGNTVYATTAEKNAYGVTYRPGPLRTLYVGIGYHFTGKHKKQP